MSADGTKFLAQEFRAHVEAQQAEDKRSDFNLPRREAVNLVQKVTSCCCPSDSRLGSRGQRANR